MVSGLLQGQWCEGWWPLAFYRDSGARGGGLWPSTGISSGQWCEGWWSLAFYRDSGARGGGLWPSTGTVV